MFQAVGKFDKQCNKYKIDLGCTKVNFYSRLVWKKQQYYTSNTL